MRLSNLGGTGISGILAVIAGFYLIWRHRSDIFGWIAAYMADFRAELERRNALTDILDSKTLPSRSAIRARLPHGALAIAAGISLIVAGQLALYIDLLS